MYNKLQKITNNESEVSNMKRGIKKFILCTLAIIATVVIMMTLCICNWNELSISTIAKIIVIDMVGGGYLWLFFAANPNLFDGR